MTSQLVRELGAQGFLATVSGLRENGHGRREIESLVRSGALLRVVRGWVATQDASQAAVTAVAYRGRLTGATALAERGIWDATDRRIHIAVRANSHSEPAVLATPIAAFRAPKYAHGEVVLHWSGKRYQEKTASPAWLASTIDSLLCVARSSDADQFIACVDSARHLGFLSAAGLPTLFALAPARIRRLAPLVNPSAESGLESVARLRLQRLGARVETQVRLPGIARGGRDGRVDLLLDGWLIVELDGDEFHDPRVDRWRNSVVVRQGYRIHRFGYEQVVTRGSELEDTVAELLRYPPPR